MISPWYHSYNFIDIWRIIEVCPLLLSCSNDSQNYEWKKLNTEETEKKEKKFKLRYWFLDFSWKHNTHMVTFVRRCLCDNCTPRFCLFLYLTDVHFRGELQHGGDVSQQKNSKISVSTNQNSRNSWCLIARCTIWY